MYILKKIILSLSKPKLALPYYQLALQLSQKERATFDKAALEARISAIQ
jgi:hypothetical protein